MDPRYHWLSGIPYKPLERPVLWTVLLAGPGKYNVTVMTKCWCFFFYSFFNQDCLKDYYIYFWQEITLKLCFYIFILNIHKNHLLKLLLILLYTYVLKHGCSYSCIRNEFTSLINSFLFSKIQISSYICVS